jgi:hypothetical protein
MNAEPEHFRMVRLHKAWADRYSHLAGRRPRRRASTCSGIDLEKLKEASRQTRK